jgi:hypothetical protein
VPQIKKNHEKKLSELRDHFRSADNKEALQTAPFRTPGVFLYLTFCLWVTSYGPLICYMYYLLKVVELSEAMVLGHPVGSKLHWGRKPSALKSASFVGGGCGGGGVSA